MQRFNQPCTCKGLLLDCLPQRKPVAISLHADAQLVTLERDANLNGLMYLALIIFRDCDRLLSDTDSRLRFDEVEVALRGCQGCVFTLCVEAEFSGAAQFMILERLVERVAEINLRCRRESGRIGMFMNGNDVPLDVLNEIVMLPIGRAR